MVITAGTSGSVFADFPLGDVVITRAREVPAARRSSRTRSSTTQTFTSDWRIPETFLPAAERLMAPFAPELVEPPLAPPSKRYAFDLDPIVPLPNDPRSAWSRAAGTCRSSIRCLTTDFFEFGTSDNGLETGRLRGRDG